MRDKYESELRELEESERHMQEKYNGMKVRLGSKAFVPSLVERGADGVVAGPE